MKTTRAAIRVRSRLDFTAVGSQRGRMTFLLTGLVAAQATSQVVETAAPEAAPVAAGGADVGILVVLGLFFAAFVALGFVYLRKKRAERIDALTAELEKPRVDDGEPPMGELPADSESAARVPKADELAAAERDAAKKRAEEDAARRERERLEAQTQASADGAAAQKLEDAKRREAELKDAAAEATARAKDLRLALAATRDGIVGKLKKTLGGKDIDASVLDDIEAVLFGADIGARTAERLLSAVKDRLSKKELMNGAKLEAALYEEAKQILASTRNEPLALEGATPRVLLVLGVNGAGKTTTIGKLASQLKGQGKKVLLGAGDTFRAAAADQLDIWAQRAEVPIVTGADGADPSSVLFEAAKKGKDEGFDVVLCDTAGRLHTKVNLMEELKKVARTLGKAVPGAPHEVLLVLDATVGQNAIAQAKQFGEAAPLTGIVLTKLDGTAKGGVILGIVEELKVPIRYIGVGEKIGDLRPFDADAFLGALFGGDGAG
jgi:fused signal recognition particle receptor